jgi:MOSC domain-containing protein YiiM
MCTKGGERMKILSVNVGMPSLLVHSSGDVLSGINKKPIEEEVFLGKINFVGDAQADLVHHGGVDKAVCVYPVEHYSFWENYMGKKLDYPSFGENLTVQGMEEKVINLGDIIQIGSAIVQVSQPRKPCYKLARKYGIPDLPLEVTNTGFTGYYFRVLQEGVIKRTDSPVLLEKHPLGITVAYANQIIHHDKKNLKGIQRILAVEALSKNVRVTLEERLKSVD